MRAAETMPTYIGTKIINAKPMSRGDYVAFRGWDLPTNENAADDGYLVEYTDRSAGNVEGFAGYITWSPVEPFEKAYRPVDQGVDIGQAIAAMRAGRRVARAGWNGKGMFLYFVQADAYPARSPVAKAHWGDGELVPYGAYVAMKTAQDNVVPWLASQTDLLATDWVVLPIGSAS